MELMWCLLTIAGASFRFSLSFFYFFLRTYPIYAAQFREQCFIYLAMFTIQHSMFCLVLFWGLGNAIAFDFCEPSERVRVAKQRKCVNRTHSGQTETRHENRGKKIATRITFVLADNWLNVIWSLRLCNQNRSQRVASTCQRLNRVKVEIFKFLSRFYFLNLIFWST